jgi:hypothetical protein
MHLLLCGHRENVEQEGRLANACEMLGPGVLCSRRLTCRGRLIMRMPSAHMDTHLFFDPEFPHFHTADLLFA